MTDNIIHPILDEYTQKLKSQGYLTCRKTLCDFKLTELSIPREYDTPDHPVLILGKCLPIDFQKKIIDPTLFEWSQEGKTLWYKENKPPGPRVWGTLTNAVNRKLQLEQQNTFLNQTICEPVFQMVFTDQIPKVVIPIIHDYLFGPVSILLEFVSKLGIHVIQTFGPNSMSTAEDKMMYPMQEKELKFARHAHSIVAKIPDFLNLSRQEQEIQLMVTLMRNEPYPYTTEFQSNLYSMIKRFIENFQSQSKISLCIASY